MCMSINFEGKDHSPVQKQRCCLVTLAGEGWCTCSLRSVLPHRVQPCRSGLVRSDVPMGKTPDMGNQP